MAPRYTFHHPRTFLSSSCNIMAGWQRLNLPAALPTGFGRGCCGGHCHVRGMCASAGTGAPISGSCLRSVAHASGMPAVGVCPAATFQLHATPEFALLIGPAPLLQCRNAQGHGRTDCCLSLVLYRHAVHCRRLPAASCKPIPRAGFPVPLVSADTEQCGLQQAAGRLQPFCSKAAEGCSNEVRHRTTSAADGRLSSIIGCYRAATQGHCRCGHG